MVIKNIQMSLLQVTILIAIVLLDKGKCFATIDTGIPIAVDPNPTTY